MLYAGSDLACGGNSGDPDTPTQSDGEDREEEPVAPLASTSEDLGSDLETSTGRMKHCGLQTAKGNFKNHFKLLFFPKKRI